MAPDRRVALHARALQVLSNSGDHARLAHHADAAGDASAVLRFAPDAARHASALGAQRESAAQYARALRFAETLAPEERAELLEHRAYECTLTDQSGDAIDALRSAITIRNELGDNRAEAEALQLLSNVLWCPGYVVDAAEAAQQAVALLEAAEPDRELVMACSRVSQLSMDAEDFDGAVAWGTRALELAEALDEPEIAMHALNSVGTARFLNGDTAGKEQLERSLALATEARLEIVRSR